MQKRAEKTYSKILASSIKIFSKKGFAATSIDDITTLAKVNRQRIYAYFGSKRGLFDTCLQTLFQKIEVFSESMLIEAEQHPEKLNEILFLGFYDIHEKYPEFRKMLAWSNLEECANPEMLLGIRKVENQRIKTIFEQNIANGLFREVNFEFYLLTIMSLPYFCHSNEKTLQKTIGLPSKDTMVKEIELMFRRVAP